jgi:hypothetical protein
MAAGDWSVKNMANTLPEIGQLKTWPENEIGWSKTWPQICWLKTCPEIGSWLRTWQEISPSNENMARDGLVKYLVRDEIGRLAIELTLPEMR